MLFGISTAILASAEEASAVGANQLDVTGHSYNVTDDCTTGVSEKEYLISSTGDKQRFGTENSVKSAHISASHVQESGRDNTYIRIHYTSGALDSNPANPFRESTVRWRAHTTYNSAYDLKEHAYLTLDFDFSADRWAYTYTLDGETGYKTAASDEEFKAYINTLTSDKAKAEECAKEAIDSKQLAYPDTKTPLNFQFVFLSSKSQTPNATLVQNSASTNWQTVSKTAFSVVKKDDGWYLQGTSSAGETVTYKLKNEVAKFDHVTMVFKVLDGGLTVQPHAYINGEYMLQLPNWEMTGSVKNCNVFYQMTLAFHKKVAEGNIADKMYDKYSLAFDNVALNYYSEDDAEIAGGLGEFMSSDEYKESLAIMKCKNVVYNDDYYTPGVPLRATITHADGNKTNCYTKNSVHKGVRNSDFVEIEYDVENFNPNPDEMRVITFTSVNGSRVSLSSEAEEHFKLQHTQRKLIIPKLDEKGEQIGDETETLTVDIYTVCYGGENDVTVRWLFEGAYGNAESGKEQKLLPMQPLANNLKITSGFKTTESGAPTIGLFKDWHWDVNGNGKIDEGDKPANEIFGEDFEKTFTRSEINEQFIEKGIKEIQLIAQFEEKPVAYAIFSDGEEAKLYAPDYDFEKFEKISTIAGAMANMEKGKNYSITLYSDLTAEQTLRIPKNATVNFNLNGYKISQAANSDSSIFAVNSGITLNLYSDKAGAEVYQTGAGRAIISANNVNNVKINLSKITDNDKSGDNLTLYGSSIVYLMGTEMKPEAPKAIEVNLNGGNYYGTVASNGALFPISDVDMKFNIKNADIVTANGEAIFSLIAPYVSSADVNVEKSNMFAGKITDDGYTVGTFIKEWNTASKIYIKESVVLGFENKYNVTLGAANKFNAKLNSEIGCDSGTLMAFSNNEKYLIKDVAISVPGFASITTDFEATLITFTGDKIEECIKPVSWLNPDGSLYKTTYWVAGSEIVAELRESLNDFEKVDLNNNWFDITYEKWMNVTAGETNKENFTVYADKENKFKPEPKYVADLNTVKVGISIYNDLAYNIYVPTPSVENYVMSFVGFFDANGKITNNVYSGVTLDGVEGWNRLIGLFATDEFAAKTITVKYTVDGQELEADVRIDIFNYAYRIDSTYGCGSAESKLVYAMMEYKHTAFLASTPSDDLKEEVDTEWQKYKIFHKTDCTCGEVNYTPSENVSDDTNIKSLVAKYSFTLVTDDENNVKYAFSIFLSEAATVKINGVAVTGMANGEYVEYTLSGIELANLADEIKIEIGTAAGMYSLANYIKETDSGFAKALYVLSVNAKNQNA